MLRYLPKRKGGRLSNVATVAMLTAVINNNLVNDNFAKPIARKCFALFCIQPKVVV